VSIKTFTGWLEEMADRFSQVATEDYENLNSDIVKLLMSKYQPVFIKFAKTTAQQNNDEELLNLIERLEKSGPADSPINHTMDRGDQVVQPISDRGIDPNSV
jgi:hypothetical protein